MKRFAITSILSILASGCIFTHMWQCQVYPSVMETKWRPYEIIKDGKEYYAMSWLVTKYEHHVFTDKAGYAYYEEFNPLFWVPQLPFVLLCEVPFRWLWEDYYAYRVPVKVDKRIRDKRYCRTVNRNDSKVQHLTWKAPDGKENKVTASMAVVDDDGLSAEVRLMFWKGKDLYKELTLEPTLEYNDVYMDTFDGRHLYLWNESSRATYLYKYYRWNGGGRTSWCPALIELDLETGVVRRLIWIEYNKMYHSDDVVIEQYKNRSDRIERGDIKAGEASDRSVKAKASVGQTKSNLH